MTNDSKTRALISRINRRLRDRDRVVRTSRGMQSEFELGRHYLLDMRSNAAVSFDVDLQELWARLHGKQIGCLARSPHEPQLSASSSSSRAIAAFVLERTPSVARLPPESGNNTERSVTHAAHPPRVGDER